MRVGVTLLVLLALGSAACAAEKRVALVIGADDYEHVRPLGNAVNDARTIEDTLEKLGFEVFLEADRDLRRMRRALDDFREDGAGADVALVFFAGHGVEIGGRNALLPVDADASSAQALEGSVLPLEELREAVSAVAPVGLILLDACRNDPFAGAAGEGRGATALVRAAETVKPGLGRMGRAENVLFAFAAAPGMTASDGRGVNSPFTAALEKYLATDGLEIRSALTLVQQEVYDATGGAQLPYIESGLPRLFFAATKGDLPERERLLLAMADITPDLRAVVEDVAFARNVPLAPLYAALLEGESGRMVDLRGREQRLLDAADAYLRARDEARTLSAADGEVAKLRAEAQRQMALGAFDTAKARLAEAAALDEMARTALGANFAARTVSKAATIYLDGAGEAARGRLDAAIASYTQAASLYDELGASMLTSEVDRQRLLTLRALADAQVSRGAVADALGTTESLKAAAGAAARREPQSPAWLAELAAAHGLSARVWIGMGVPDVALGELDQGRRAAERALALKADDAAALAVLAQTFGQIGSAREQGGALREGLAAYVRQVEVLNGLLAAGGPADGLLRQIASLYGSIGDLNYRLRQFDTARSAFEAAGKIRRETLAAEPDSPRARFEATAVDERLGDLALEAGELDAAERGYRARYDVVVDLHAAYPEQTEFARDLSVSHEKRGDLARARKDPAAARASYETALALMRDLVVANPANPAFQGDAALVKRKVGEARFDAGDFAAALALFEEARAEIEALLAREPANRAWRDELATSYDHGGAMLFRLGRKADSLASYLKALEVIGRLVEEAPGEPRLLANLSLAHRQVASLGHEPVNNLEAAVRILEALERQDLLGRFDREAPAAARAELEAAREAAQ
ncbi:MAG: caspase family protein [Rhizobiaceae bacterium]|nr:caspase family protein [Rhizobiaceae bacterium]